MKYDMQHALKYDMIQYINDIVAIEQEQDMFGGIVMFKTCL